MSRSTAHRLRFWWVSAERSPPARATTFLGSRRSYSFAARLRTFFAAGVAEQFDEARLVDDLGPQLLGLVELRRAGVLARDDEARLTGDRVRHLAAGGLDPFGRDLARHVRQR